MAYDAPGYADELSDELRQRWNETIRRAYDSQNDALKSRFFTLDPGTLRDPRPSDAIAWPGDPGKPAFCVGEANAQALSDWGLTGRRAVQLEYCEYLVVNGRDATGARRPKRVEVTTEFREFWACVATHDPDRVRAMATEVLGFEPSWGQLYGVADPHALGPEAREIAFGRTVAGHGNDRRLRVAGVPAQPAGRLNMERALFMTHPINGIDDLIYVAIFGAHPYAVSDRDERRQASGDDVFSAFNVAHLACNHADPTISLGVYDAVFRGSQVAFADPLGMYIREPNLDVFSYRGQPLPEDWVRFGRGRQGLHQRLVFGPPDEHDAFLDDVVLALGASEQPVTAATSCCASWRSARCWPSARPTRSPTTSGGCWSPRPPRSPATKPSPARRSAICSSACKPSATAAAARARWPSPPPDGAARRHDLGAAPPGTRALSRGGRAGAEDRRTRHALRARDEPAARRWRQRTGGRRVRVRLRRSGSPQPGLPHVRGHDADGLRRAAAARRRRSRRGRVPKRSRPTRSGGVGLRA